MIICLLKQPFSLSHITIHILVLYVLSNYMFIKKIVYIPYQPEALGTSHQGPWGRYCPSPFQLEPDLKIEKKYF